MTKPRYNGTMTLGYRDQSSGWMLVYVGGHHTIWCDGTSHHQIDDDGAIWWNKHSCEDWTWPCPGQE